MEEKRKGLSVASRWKQFTLMMDALLEDLNDQARARLEVCQGEKHLYGH